MYEYASIKGIPSISAVNNQALSVLCVKYCALFSPKKLADIDPLNIFPLVNSTLDADGVLIIFPNGYSSLNNKVLGPIKLPVLP